MKFEKMFEDANSFTPENSILENVTDSQIFGDTATEVQTGDTPPPPQSGPDGNSMQGEAATNQNAFNPQQSQTMNLGVLPTEIAISVIDKAGSTLVAVICKLAGVKNVKAKQLEFTAKEKEAMEQPTETLLKSMNVVMSPLSQFAIVMGAIYAAKVMAIVSADQDSKGENLADKNELNGSNSGTTGTRAKRGPYKKTARKR